MCRYAADASAGDQRMCPADASTGDQRTRSADMYAAEAICAVASAAEASAERTLLRCLAEASAGRTLLRPGASAAV